MTLSGSEFIQFLFFGRRSDFEVLGYICCRRSRVDDFLYERWIQVAGERTSEDLRGNIPLQC